MDNRDDQNIENENKIESNVSENKEIDDLNTDNKVSEDSSDNSSDKDKDAPEERIEMMDQSQKDILSMISPKQNETEFHLINKKNLPQKKDRYAGYEYKPPSVFKRFLLVVFMLLIIVLVIFMPEINTYVKRYIGKEKPEENEITTGKLICKATENINPFTYDRRYVFNYTDNKLERLTYTNTAKASADDSELLDVKYEECNVLSNYSDSIDGVVVSCELDGTSVVEKQTIDYNTYNRDQMITAFVEAGGTYPDYESGMDIDLVEKSMKASGYTCEKSK